MIEVLCQFSKCVERASVDEAYVDLTEEVNKKLEDQVIVEQLPNTWVVGWDTVDSQEQNDSEREEMLSNPADGRAAGLQRWLQEVQQGSEMSIENRRLAAAAVIVEEMRAAVYNITGFRCSAGIAHNKMLGKLSCGLHKPNQQTVLPHDSVPGMFSTLPIKKVRGFGGKFGEAVVDSLGVENMGDLVHFTQKQLCDAFGEKSGNWVYDVCRGFEYEPVNARQLPKSIGCSKNFRGREKLDTKEKVRHWIGELSKEVTERLVKDKEQNKRVAKNLIVSLHTEDHNHASRSCALLGYNAEKMAKDGFTLLSKFDVNPPHQSAWSPAVTSLSVMAGKFEDCATESIKGFLVDKSKIKTKDCPSTVQTPVTKSSGKEVIKGGQKTIQNFFSTQTTPTSSTQISQVKPQKKGMKIDNFFVPKVSKKDDSFDSLSDEAGTDDDFVEVLGESEILNVKGDNLKPTTLVNSLKEQVGNTKEIEKKDNLVINQNVDKNFENRAPSPQPPAWDLK